MPPAGRQPADMGYTTDFVGHIDIEPALNQDEIEYLTAFSLSRRFDRPDGPYAVPGNPRAEDTPADVDRYNRPAPGQPQLWCQWVPCWDGCCLSFDGHEKFYAPIEWMRYLIDHFLRPDAHASDSALAEFAHFTFDHHCDGIVVGCRRDNKELFAIDVRDNQVATTILRPGEPEYWGRPQLPYESEIDRWRATRRRRRGSAGQTANIVDLSDRRGS